MADPIDPKRFLETNKDRLATVPWDIVDAILLRASLLEDRGTLFPRRIPIYPVWKEPTLKAFLITNQYFLIIKAVCDIDEEYSNETRFGDSGLGFGIEPTAENIVKSDPSYFDKMREFMDDDPQCRQKLVRTIHVFLKDKVETNDYLLLVRAFIFKELEENDIDPVAIEWFRVVFRNKRDINRNNRQTHINGLRGIHVFLWSNDKIGEFLHKCTVRCDEIFEIINSNNKFLTEVSPEGEIVKRLTMEKGDLERDDEPIPLTITQFFPKNTNSRDEDNEDELPIVVSESEPESEVEEELEEESDVENDEDQLSDENNESVDGAEGPSLYGDVRGRPCNNPNQDDDDDDDEVEVEVDQNGVTWYVVEDVRNQRINPKTKKEEYLLKWKDFPESDNTWEEYETLDPIIQRVAKDWYHESQAEETEQQQRDSQRDVDMKHNESELELNVGSEHCSNVDNEEDQGEDDNNLNNPNIIEDDGEEDVAVDDADNTNKLGLVPAGNDDFESNATATATTVGGDTDGGNGNGNGAADDKSPSSSSSSLVSGIEANDGKEVGNNGNSAGVGLGAGAVATTTTITTTTTTANKNMNSAVTNASRNETGTRSNATDIEQCEGNVSDTDTNLSAVPSSTTSTGSAAASATSNYFVREEDSENNNNNKNNDDNSNSNNNNGNDNQSEPQLPATKTTSTNDGSPTKKELKIQIQELEAKLKTALAGRTSTKKNGVDDTAVPPLDRIPKQHQQHPASGAKSAVAAAAAVVVVVEGKGDGTKGADTASLKVGPEPAATSATLKEGDEHNVSAIDKGDNNNNKKIAAVTTARSGSIFSSLRPTKTWDEQLREIEEERIHEREEGRVRQQLEDERVRQQLEDERVRQQLEEERVGVVLQPEEERVRELEMVTEEVREQHTTERSFEQWVQQQSYEHAPFEQQDQDQNQQPRLLDQVPNPGVRRVTWGNNDIHDIHDN